MGSLSLGMMKHCGQSFSMTQLPSSGAICSAEHSATTTGLQSRWITGISKLVERERRERERERERRERRERRETNRQRESDTISFTIL